MQQCGACGSKNGNRDRFCGACGELIRADPGFARQVQHLIREERKARRSKVVTGFFVSMAILGFVGYQVTSSMITAAIGRVMPAVQTRLQSEVERKIRTDLPSLVHESSQQVAKDVSRELAQQYVEAARKEAETFQPDFRTRIQAIQAEYEGKLRAAYDSAQTSIRTQPLSLGWATSAVYSVLTN